MKDRRVPDLYIEKLLLDELPEAQKRQLLSDPDVVRRLERLRAENRRILEQYPPEQMAKVIRNRRESNGQAESARERAGGRVSAHRPAAHRMSVNRPPTRRSPLNWARLIPAVSFALLVVAGGLLLVTRGPSLFGPQSQAEQVRVKGGSAAEAAAGPAAEQRQSGQALTVYMKTDSGARELASGDRVHAGSTVQLAYTAGTYRYGTILSIDGRGAVTLHFPASAATGQELDGEGEVPLPFAYTLDDAPEFERFFFAASDRPFSVEKVIRAAEELAESPQASKTRELDLPRGVQQSAILLLK